MFAWGSIDELPARTEVLAVAEPALDRFAELARRLLVVPTALVTLVDNEGQVFPGAAGLPEPWQTTRRAPLTHSLSQHVVAKGVPLIVSDAREDPLLASYLSVTMGTVVAYAGIPLTDGEGAVIGTLCAVDQVPRDWTEEELSTLEVLTAACSTEIRVRHLADSMARKSTRLSTLVESMPVGYMAYDADWRVTTANAEAGRIVETRTEDLIGNVVWDLFPATVGSQFETTYRQVRETGVPAKFEFYFPRPLNKWYDIRVLSTSDELAAFFVDVTDRHLSDGRADTILSAMPVGFLAMDETFRVSAANRLGAAMLGSTVDELVGHGLWDLFPGHEKTRFGQMYMRVARTGHPEVLVDYSPRLDAWYDVRAISAEGRLSLFFIDVTETQRAQALLEQAAEHDRSVAQTLQAALLTALPAVSGARLAARYLTAEGTEQVGGDWYDAVLQPSDSLAVSVGDVCGHGIEAAAGMGQLRAMLRGFISDGGSTVADSLSRLDRAAFGHPEIPMATVVSGRVEGLTPGGRPRLVWSNAGHPPPLLVLADGTVERLEARPELMLGVLPDTRRSDHERDLPPGSTLVLYTDGLVESPSSSVAQGIDRLARALSGHHCLGLDELLDRTLDELRPGHRHDDIAVLGIRIDPLPADGQPADQPADQPAEQLADGRPARGGRA